MYQKISIGLFVIALALVLPKLGAGEEIVPRSNSEDTSPPGPPEEKHPREKDKSSDSQEENSSGSGSTSPAMGAAAEKKETSERSEIPWRKDPNVRRRPGSYLGGGMGYLQGRAWYQPTEKEFDDKIEAGPLHGWQAHFRVGDALYEWFSMGLQIDLGNIGYGSSSAMSAFALLLDVTFFPYKGLGIRPSAGIGFSFAQGEEEYEMGFGGPGCLSLAFTYEFRVSRLFVIAPVAQVYWIAGEDFNGFYLSLGIDFIKWFASATG